MPDGCWTTEAAGVELSGNFGEVEGVEAAGIFAVVSVEVVIGGGKIPGAPLVPAGG